MSFLNFLDDIPDNWLRLTLNDIAKWGSGGTPTSTDSRYYNGEIPWVIIGDLNDGLINSSEKTITELGLKNSSAKIVQANSVLIAMYGSIGKLAINQVPLATNQAIAFTETLSENVLNRFLFYYLLAIRSKLYSLGKGGTQRNISQTVLKEVEFPIPPLSEQRRIVAKIEELLSELDKGVENLKLAQRQLKVYRQAVLKHAFEGKLTADWREANGISEEWKETPFSEIVQSYQNGLSKRSGIEGKDIIVLRLADIGKQTISIKAPRKILLTQKEQDKYLLEKGDILIIRVNGSPDLAGRFIAVTSLEDSIAYCDHFIRLKLKSPYLTKFIFHVSQTKAFRNYIQNNMVCSAGQNTISQGTLNGFSFLCPSLSEQCQIVEILENKLSLIEQMEQEIETNLAKAKGLRQSILKQAFSGHLVPQDPTDEPASVLLERIRAEKAQQTSAKKAKKTHNKKISKKPSKQEAVLV